MVFEIIEISLFLRVYFWLNIGFTDFEKHVKTSKFHRIFGLYRLLSDFRITDINLVNFEKLDRTLSISKKYDRTSTFHRIFWFVKHLSNNYHQLLIDLDYRQSSVKFLISKHTIIVQLSLHNYRVSI